MQEVRVRLPKDFDAEQAYPLLFMLHGNGGRAAGLSSLLAPYSGRPVILAFPEGLYPRAVPSGVGFSWFYATADRNVWETADGLSVENILEIIEALSRRYRAGGVYVFGFSEGASLAYMAGLRNPSLIRGVAAVGGTLPEIGGQGLLLTPQLVDQAKALRIFIARGRGDKLMKEESFEAQRDYFKSRGYDVTALEYIGGHVLAPGLLDRLFSWIQDDIR
jgi:phospholipase/carboxylesterase